MQTDIELLMGSDDWGSHPGVLARVTHNSALGEAMFATSEAVIARSRFNFNVKQNVKMIENKARITHDEVLQAKVPLGV